MSCSVSGQNVTITDSLDYTADSSAILDVKSSNKGFLPPRLTTVQRNGIYLPAAGLLVFDVDAGSYYYYSGTEWLNLSDYNNLSNKPAIPTESNIKSYIANDVDSAYIPMSLKNMLGKSNIYSNDTKTGIGTENSTEKLSVSGNVIADDYYYNNHQARCLRIAGGTGCYEKQMNLSYNNTFYAQLSNGSTSSAVFYNLDLPDSATITGIQVYLWVGAGTTTCGIFYGNDNYGTEIVSVSKAANYNWAWTSLATCSHIVDKNNYAYGINCYNYTPGDNPIGSIKVFYTVNKTE